MGIGVFVPLPSSHQVGLRYILIILGVACCATIIGLLPGVIFIVFAFVFKKVACPICKNDVLINRDAKAFTCCYCHKRLLIKNGIIKNIK